MNTVLSEAESYQLAGFALAASQVFEVAFVVAAKLALKQDDANTLDEVVPLSASRSFKQPIAAILKELTAVEKVPAEVEQRMAVLIDKRHTLVHRAFAEFGWPAIETDEAALRFKELCLTIHAESTSLGHQLHLLILAWMKRFPETSTTVRKHQEQFGILTDDIDRAAAAFKQK